ncbi:phosphate ABC transporter substrate-binding protein PstS [Chitinimonas sp.]|uniref:phosphate ABC transporter substrate-binding protein PstS n=1 Tax=Chitinimonas sp. TaxID=1934313 RepID=UPI0035B047CD
MKLQTLMAVALVGATSALASAAGLSGAGSTFAEPLYKRWGEMYAAQDAAKGPIAYEGVGSGEGLNRILAKKVDFGASDEPLKRSELEEKGLRQFPVAMGAIVPVVNLPGIPAGELKLNADVLAKIYLGKIKRWNEADILNLNDGLPKKALDVPIKPVYRADGSGSTFVFSYYLASQSPAWKSGPGIAKELRGVTGLAAKGTGGVVDAVKANVGAIGYVDYGRAIKDKLNISQLPNRVGVFMKVNNESIQAAVKYEAERSIYSDDADFYLVLANNDTYGGWPLATATFVLLPRKEKDINKVLSFLVWGLKNGDAVAKELGYVPLTETLKVAVRKAWSQQYGFKL